MTFAAEFMVDSDKHSENEHPDKVDLIIYDPCFREEDCNAEDLLYASLRAGFPHNKGLETNNLYIINLLQSI